MNDLEIDVSWRYIAKVVQEKIRLQEDNNFKRMDLNQDLRKAMFGRLAHYFGAEFNIAENRSKRMDVLMAIFGRVLSSVNDLKYHEAYYFLEVTNEFSASITTMHADRFQTELTEHYSFTPWLYASGEETLAVWDLPSADERDGSTASSPARSDSDEGTRAGAPGEIPLFSEPPF